MRRKQPRMGKRRIADDLAKANNWVPIVSPNTVRSVLEEAGLWKPDEGEQKNIFRPVVQTAEEPGQAINVDLCFVPGRHAVTVKLPAVSGSSGCLVVERLKDDQPCQYPRRVFEDQSLDYAAAMQAFVTASAQAKQPTEQPEDIEKTSTRASIRCLRQAEEHLRIEQRKTRNQRRQEDVD